MLTTRWLCVGTVKLVLAAILLGVAAAMVQQVVLLAVAAVSS